MSNTMQLINTNMKISLKILSIAILLILGNKAMAQQPFSKVKYIYDANGNRWQRLPEINLWQNNTDSLKYNKAVANPVKESILDSSGIKSIVIFPNPTFDKLQINISSDNPTPLIGTIKVFNVSGSSQLLSQTLALNNEVNFTSLAAGSYMLKVEVNGNIKVFKVIKN